MWEFQKGPEGNWGSGFVEASGHGDGQEEQEAHSYERGLDIFRGIEQKCLGFAKHVAKIANTVEVFRPILLPNLLVLLGLKYGMMACLFL
jgi:hypothetical protein